MKMSTVPNGVMGLMPFVGLPATEMSSPRERQVATIQSIVPIRTSNRGAPAGGLATPRSSSTSSPSRL